MAFAAEMVAQAKDPLELEDAHVFQELSNYFNSRYEVLSKLVGTPGCLGNQHKIHLVLGSSI